MSADEILLSSLYRVEDPTLYKLHLARWNGATNPLDAFVRDREEWTGWNRWKGDRDDFNRGYIFSLIDFYPQRDRWLFGGAYRVISRTPTARASSYEIQVLPESEPLIGRLKVRLQSPGRARAFYFEKHYPSIVVDEILPSVYSGEPFVGFDRIDLSFAELESIVVTQRPDWKTALQHAKGIYLITDESNGKRYVGSAYGDSGIWSRWECYVGTGHGHNVELGKVSDFNQVEYARLNFRFALIEHMAPNIPDDRVVERESHWKRVLLTRGDYGYNRN